jgi:hypothetical protein
MLPSVCVGRTWGPRAGWIQTERLLAGTRAGGLQRDDRWACHGGGHGGGQGLARADAARHDVRQPGLCNRHGRRAAAAEAGGGVSWRWLGRPAVINAWSGTGIMIRPSCAASIAPRHASSAKSRSQPACPGRARAKLPTSVAASTGLKSHHPMDSTASTSYSEPGSPRRTKASCGSACARSPRAPFSARDAGSTHRARETKSG